jgi:hypothetical protein
MALAPSITYTLADGDGDTAATAVYVPIGDTLVRYGEFAVVHAETMEPLVLGVFQPTAILSIPVDISALTGNVAAAESDVEQIAQFSFADTDNEPVKVNVPGCNVLQHVVVGSDALDLADADIAAFISMMEDGIEITGAVTVSPSGIAESDIVDTFYARKATKNSGRKK